MSDFGPYEKVQHGVAFAGLAPYIASPLEKANEGEGKEFKPSQLPVDDSQEINVDEETGEEELDYVTLGMALPMGVTQAQGGEAWMQQEDGTHMALCSVDRQQTVEPSKVTSGVMNAQNIAPSASYIGATGLIQCIDIGSDKYTVVKGPSTWRDWSPICFINYQSPTVYQGAPHPRPMYKEDEDVPVLSDGSQMAPFFSVEWGDNSNERKGGNRYIAYVQLPGPRAPVIFKQPAPGDTEALSQLTSRGALPEDMQTLNNWSRLPRKAREHYRMPQTGRQDFHFEIRPQGNNLTFITHPAGSQQEARYKFKVDEAEPGQTNSYNSSGLMQAMGGMAAPSANGMELFASNPKLYPPGPNLIFRTCGCRMQIGMVARMTLREDVTKHKVRLFTGGGGSSGSGGMSTSGVSAQADDEGEGGESQLDRVKVVVETVGAHVAPMEIDSNSMQLQEDLRMVAPEPVEDVARLPKFQIHLSEDEDSGDITANISQTPGIKKTFDGTGPVAYFYGRLRGIRAIKEPSFDTEGIGGAQAGTDDEDEMSDDNPSTTTPYEFIYNITEYTEQMSLDRGGTSARLSVNNTGYPFNLATFSSPPDAESSPTSQFRSLDGIRGIPIKIWGGFADKDPDTKHTLLERLFSYVTETAQRVSENKESSLTMTLNDKMALLKKSKVLDFPALDNYSHLWGMKYLINYAGVHDAEIAPWTLVCEGPTETGSTGDVSLPSEGGREVSIALVDKMFPRQSDTILASWDYPLPGHYNNTGKNWRFKPSMGDSIDKVAGQIADTFGWRMYFDRRGRFHYEPDWVRLALTDRIDAEKTLRLLCKGDALTGGFFEYDSNIMELSATAHPLTRYDAVLVIGEAEVPMCVCGYPNCQLDGQVDPSGLYHTVAWGGTKSWNHDKRIFTFKAIDTSAQAEVNPMMQKNYLIVKNPAYTTPQIVASAANSIADWAKKDWMNATTVLKSYGQPHLEAGDIIPLRLGSSRWYFHIRSITGTLSEDEYSNTMIGVIIPNSIATPPEDPTQFGWAGGWKPQVVTDAEEESQ